MSGVSQCEERDGEQRQRDIHSDNSCSSGTFPSSCRGKTKEFGTSEQGEADVGFSNRVESFRSPSRSAKLTRNGSSISVSCAGASGTEDGAGEEVEERGVVGTREGDGVGGLRGTWAGGGVCTSVGELGREGEGSDGVRENIFGPSSARREWRRSVSVEVKSVPGG